MPRARFPRLHSASRAASPAVALALLMALAPGVAASERAPDGEEPVAPRSLEAGEGGAAEGAASASRTPLGQDPEATVHEVLDPDRLEFAVLPGVSANSDTGVGFGVLGTLAGFEPGYDPFRWRFELFLFLTLKEAPDGSIEDPFHYYYLKYDFPDVAGDWLRFSGEISFKRFSTTGYYGIGNATPELAVGDRIDPQSDPDGAYDPGRYYQYDRIFPKAELNARLRVADGLEVFTGASFTYNWFNWYPGSKLSEDLAGKGGDLVRSLLLGAEEHGALLGQVGLLFDNRDHEYTPQSGMFHEASILGGVGIGSPFGFGRANITLRFYQSIYGEWLVFAARAMGDVLFGDAPFYELARFGGLNPRDAPGGSEAVRGVPAQRYHGKLKVLGNVELRSKLWAFEIFDQRMNLGVVAFADTGRVWTDWEDHPELDGEDVGLKVGTGGGVRFQWGETFIARIDTAWSPDGVGFYVEAYHVF